MLKDTCFVSSSRCRSSRNVRSGCPRICSRIHSCTDLVTRLSGPWRHTGGIRQGRDFAAANPRCQRHLSGISHLAHRHLCQVTVAFWLEREKTEVLNAIVPSDNDKASMICVIRASAGFARVVVVDLRRWPDPMNLAPVLQHKQHCSVWFR